jgi:ferredoxin-nitrite reductase
VRSLRDQKLNKVEKFKLERHPLEVREAILESYSKNLSAMDEVPGEVERLKWVGIYPQKQGGDAFMIRIKIPGGVLSAEQARTIGRIAVDFARGPEPNPHFGNNFLDLTTRQDIQMHWIHMRDVPEIWRRLESVGMTTVQACGDSARNVLCCPVSGLDGEEILDAYPVAQAISDYFTGNREYANLPRKFKLSVTGCLEDCGQAEINDVGLLPARLEDGTVGFNLRVGGGLSDGPRMASDVDVFVRPEQAVEITRAIAQVFGELGNRENRWANRLRYLVQELGSERFREELQSRASFELTPAGEDLTKRYRGDHIGVHQQKEDGLYYVGLNVPVGRMSGEHLVEAARLAEEYGEGVRLATDQNLILTGVPEEKLDELLDEPLLQRFSPRPGAFERGIVACTGNEFCRFAIVETKIRAVEWAKEMDERSGMSGRRRCGCTSRAARRPARSPRSGTWLPRRDGQDEDLHRRGRGHRPRRFPGPGRCVYRLGRGREADRGGPDALVSVFESSRRRARGRAFHEWARRKKNRELARGVAHAAKVGAARWRASTSGR